MSNVRKMKRICFVIPKSYQLFNPAVRSTFGGAEVQATALARELARTGNVEVHILVADYGQQDVEEQGGIRIWNAIHFTRSWPRRMWHFLTAMRKIGPDVIVQATLTPYSGLLALFARMSRRRFLFMVMHDGEADGSMSVPGGSLGKLSAHLVFRFCHTIIVQNSYQSASLPFQTYTINPGIRIADRRATQKRGMLWVGRSEYWKRPEMYLELARLFPDEQFVMVCPPSTMNPELSGQIEKRAASMPNVIFHRFVPFEDAQKLFEQARVFVNTSTQEGFPTTFLQAATVSVPVLSLLVDPNGFLRSARCGFSCGDDLNLLAEHLERLLQNHALYAEYSENIRRYVAAHHDIGRSAEQLLHIIEA